MNIQMKINLKENSSIRDFQRKLRDLNYEVTNMGADTFTVEQPRISGYFQNGFSTFLIRRTIIKMQDTIINVQCDLNVSIFVFLIACALASLGIQLFLTDLSKDIVTLIKVVPILIIIGFVINIAAVISTVKRDIKTALKDK